MILLEANPISFYAGTVDLSRKKKKKSIPPPPFSKPFLGFVLETPKKEGRKGKKKKKDAEDWFPLYLQLVVTQLSMNSSDICERFGVV